MDIRRLDHANLRTTRLDEMVDWYGRVLDMPPGPRPPFGFPGAWLYRHGNALVHLVGVDAEGVTENVKLEHFAFEATGLAAFLERLKVEGVEYRLARVPGFGILQVNIFDPDGNHIHVDFAPAEADALGL